MATPESLRRPLTRMRRAIAKSMLESARIPQFTIEWDVDFEPVLRFRQALETRGQAVSPSDCIVAACARGLREYPQLNSSFDEDAIVQHADVNVGWALALTDGLVVPAIRNADRQTLAELGAERARLTLAATNGALTPDDVYSATFTVSNLGPLGVRRFRALVVPPQAAILAVGAICKDSSVSLSLSCDHRVLDGAPAALFLRRIVELLESNDWLEEVSTVHGS